MGGGAIRAAAKTAAYRSPAIFGGTATVRRTSFPSSSTGSSVAAAAPPPAEAPISALTSEKSRSEAAVQRPALDLDDWEFAGWAAEEETMTPPARVVFGPAPTFEEAKAATDDLKDAFQRTNICMSAASDSTIVRTMPGHVVQAFSFLQGSPQAQDVIASIACDKNVWEAVLNNEKVMEFYNSHQAALPKVDIAEDVNSNNISEESSAGSNPSSGFKGFINNFMMKVEEVVKNISSFFQDILGNSPVSIGKETAQNNGGSHAESAVGLGATFVGLAVATILVIMFKRV